MGWLDFLKRKNTQPINEQVTERQAAIKKLQEDVSNYPDFFASLFDRYWSNGNWWYPVSSLPSIGSDHNKKHGKDWYIFRTELELRTQRDASRLLYAREPVAKTIEGNLNAFVIGKGMTYKIIAKKAFKDKISPEQIQPWQAYLDEWFDLERWPEREQECYTCKVVDGEFFLRIVKYQGRLTVRRIEPEYITNPPGGTEVNGWYMGVNYSLRDAETPLAYCYWPNKDQPHEIIPASEIIHYKANVTRNVSRGVSDFFPIVDDLNSIAGLSDNMRDGATARAEIAYMWSIKNATPAAISSFAGTQKDAQTTNPITGKTDRSKGMKSGKAVAHGDNVEFTTMPQGDSQGYISVLQAALRMIGNRWCLPEYMISADASNNNYASIQVAGSPFTRFVEREQNALKRPFKQMVMMVLQQAAVQMVIPTSVLPMIDIEIGCDSPVIVDKLAEAQVNEIEVRNGVLSPQQWCMAQGRDFDQTQQQIDEWRDANMEAMLQQQGIPTESDGGDAEDEPVQEAVQWDEHKHPRAQDGKFGSGGGAAKKAVKVSHDVKPEPTEQEKDKLADDTVKAVMAARGEVKTGVPYEFNYAHNTEKSGHFGNTYGQEVEPHGRYLVDIGDTVGNTKGWEYGKHKFDNPLVIEFGGGYQDESNWKNVLSKKYGGKTGRALSQAIRDDGHDGIITTDKYGTSEIVDLSSFKQRKSQKPKG